MTQIVVRLGAALALAITALVARHASQPVFADTYVYECDLTYYFGYPFTYYFYAPVPIDTTYLATQHVYCVLED